MPEDVRNPTATQESYPPDLGRAVSEKSYLTRQRYLELIQLGIRAAEELEKHGLKHEEYCEFGRIMDRLMQLK